jgi:UDP-2,4-diacetamido-2,4,6-trideoxy-beta-L-altropyranose hydrolase
MGHVMRCLTLADAFRELGAEIFFISRYPEGEALITRKGYPVWATEEEVREQCFDVIVIDTYDVTPNDLTEWTKRGLSVYVDDLNAFPCPTDVILNGNLTADRQGYYPVFPGQLLLLGMPYHLLRQEFTALPKRSAIPNPRQILITTGASDPANMTCKILQWLLEDKQLESLSYQVVIGPAFVKQNEVLQLAARYPNIRCHIQPSNMSEIMIDCDLAICAGGSTLYELAACGVPALAFIYAENQRLLIETMGKIGNLIPLGWYADMTGEELSAKLMELMGNYAKRQTMISKLQNLEDGGGAKRAAQKILTAWSDDERVKISKNPRELA